MTDNLFDVFTDRSDCHSAKWAITRKYGKDMISMSVADMDLPAPQMLINYLAKQNRTGIYGYTVLPDNYHNIVRRYLLRHYQYEIANEYIIFCPRIIQAISIYIKEFTFPTESIAILTPSYAPIVNAILLNKRTVESCALIYQAGKYTIDFSQLEKCFQIAKTFILISPHNPTGTVWSHRDLQRIATLAEKYGVFILSDDVHADFDFSGSKHIIISAISSYVEKHSIICTSPAKTFNIPGLEISNLLICNKNVRDKFQGHMQALGMHNPNFFSIPALQIAYQYCDDWLDELRDYIFHNKLIVKNFFTQEIPQLEMINSEGTYLIWVNYSKLQISEEKLRHWFLDLSRIEVSWGSDFGKEGLSFFRMNVAMPRALLKESLERMKQGLALLMQEELNHE
ncbi:TPA: pyridoxal phosphate-dependent aminotransferase [Pasteurella multocida]|uniref:MalY/PatB family protein n=1 Tax=Pasteurella multocida TaxID=747 RepID=UPI000233F7B9|nr:MalY/PatB family protein [Pasteurella multocida]AWW60377.1 pyridoxal phosphate-dependent aminotransferase [Pasteurellaceae bacterium 12591]AET16487.1 cystathionine beta-lyase PatB [Pasteurella multocida 36950]AHE64984.1 cystathionine beta-lyase PatB [Pasteurella multocida subsp. multocida str. HB03]AIN48357.1 C-S lyase family protein [Pasteurella multocida]ANJ90793.1 cystathionine beta-lyase PatB [Pasteurella multocida subsp. multocida HB01]